MRLSTLFAFLITLSVAASGQNLIVTAEGHDHANPSQIDRDSISVEVNRHPAQIKQWIPAGPQQLPLQLYVVIDDGLDSDVGNQLSDVKAFINSLDAPTSVGLAYLRYGGAEIVAPMSTDHASVAGKVRIPLSQPGISASPFMGISELIKKWPPADARREILLISSGIDPWLPVDPQNPYLLTAISDAQRAGILVHSIYYGESGHLGHSFWRVNWGQNYLSELGDETGGEGYWEGTGSPVSFAPFLKDLSQRFGAQYLLTIDAPAEKPGLQSVRVTTSARGVSLMSASKVNLAH